MSKLDTNDIYDKITVFLVPEKQLSLKLVFDNVRNYGIIALIYLLHLWLKKESSMVTAGLISAIGLSGPRFAVVPLIVAGVLLLLNVGQSLILISGLLKPIFDFSSLGERLPATKLDGWGRVRRFLLSLVGLWLALGILTMLLNFFMAVLLFAVVSGIK